MELALRIPFREGPPPIVPEQTQQLYGKLGARGITQRYLRDYVLPAWWDDSATETKAGFAEFVVRVGKGLGLSVESLLDPASEPVPDALPKCLFKGRDRLNDFATVVGISRRVAELAIAATDSGSSEHVGLDPRSIRNEILAEGEPWVDLQNLSDYCWRRGIPVLHVTKFPKGVRKPDGMLVSAEGKPAIVICKNQRQPAWLLFILAHELGHLIAGHLDGVGMIVDEKITEEIDQADEQERVADENALAILVGRTDNNYRDSQGPPKASVLAERCREKGKRDGVYPGHIVLNYVHGLSGSFHGLGNAALKELYPHANAGRTLSRLLNKHLDFSRLSEDQAEFLVRLVAADGSVG